MECSISWTLQIQYYCSYFYFKINIKLLNNKQDYHVLCGLMTLLLPLNYEGSRIHSNILKTYYFEMQLSTVFAAQNERVFTSLVDHYESALCIAVLHRMISWNKIGQFLQKIVWQASAQGNRNFCNKSNIGKQSHFNIN